MIYLRRVRTICLLIISLLFFSGTVFSQRVIEIKYQANAKGGYVFSCINYAYCNYILELGFTQFDNLRSDRTLPFHGEIKPGYNSLFTISPINPNDPIQFKYSSATQKGCMHPVVNSDFTYLLPVSPGKDAQVYEMSPDKPSDTANWYVLRLKMKPGDTIYAARKGIVNIVEDRDASNDAGQNSIGKENFIELVQPDCSFARYGILKKNSAMVIPGQLVKAGQPIGLVGGDTFGRGSEIRFSVYYFQEESGGLSQSPSRHFVITQIWTKDQGKGRLRHGAVYVAEFPKSVVNQEATAPVKKKPVKSKH